MYDYFSERGITKEDWRVERWAITFFLIAALFGTLACIMNL